MMRALPIFIALAGCAAMDPDPNDDEAELQRELATMERGEPKTCILQSGPGALTPVSAATVTYRDGATIWVNRLRAECPGLDAYDRLLVETHGNQYCRGDKIRSLEPAGGIPGPYCFLGDWVPYRPRG